MRRGCTAGSLCVCVCDDVSTLYCHFVRNHFVRNGESTRDLSVVLIYCATGRRRGDPRERERERRRSTSRGAEVFFVFCFIIIISIIISSVVVSSLLGTDKCDGLCQFSILYPPGRYIISSFSSRSSLGRACTTRHPKCLLCRRGLYWHRNSHSRFHYSGWVLRKQPRIMELHNKGNTRCMPNFMITTTTPSVVDRRIHSDLSLLSPMNAPLTLT